MGASLIKQIEEALSTLEISPKDTTSAALKHSETQEKINKEAENAKIAAAKTDAALKRAREREEATKKFLTPTSTSVRIQPDGSPTPLPWYSDEDYTGSPIPWCDNNMCKNIDSKNSIPGREPVYVCPNATCNAEGGCDCGKGCVRDPYTRMCCKNLTASKDMFGKITYYCHEGDINPTKPPKRTQEPKRTQAPKPKCNVSDQYINGKLVKGQTICDIYKQYN